MTQSSFSHALPLPQMLNCNPTNEAFEEGKHAFAAKNYDDAVKHYTTALEAMQADLSSVIHAHRAVAYEKQNRHDLAVEDMRAANLCGNTTYRDPHFAQTSREAIPQAAPPRGVLTTKYGQALTASENHNQYLVQVLPSEVLACILSSLSTKDCVRLGMTCRFWYDFMFHKWPRMWHTVDPGKDFPCSFRLISSTRRYIKAIQAEQVKDLQLKFSSVENPVYRDPGENVRRHRQRRSTSEESGNILLDFMDYRWSGVEILKMSYCTESLFDRVSCFVGENLKRLTLTKSSSKNNYGIHILKKAARNFPKLQTMTNDFGVADYNIPLLHYLKGVAQVPNFQLTSLSMPRKLGGSMDHIFQDVPDLTSLTIDSRYIENYANLLESVHRHCPALETFNFSLKATQQLSTTHTRPVISSVSGGLKTLILRPTKVYSDTNANPHLALMLQRAYKTLRTLDLQLDMLENGRFSALDTLVQSGAPRLQTLILEASQKCSIASQSISNLISACPSLVTVKLTGANFWHDSIFVGLVNLSRLQKLSLEVTYRGCIPPRQGTGCEGYITTQCLQSFFERAKNIVDFSYVHCPVNIYIRNHHFILELIKAASLSSVRKLDLKSNKLTGETLLCSLRYLQDSQVQTLKIRVACPIGDRELQAFTGIPRLTYLIIYDEENYIDEHKVCTLLDRWQYPQMLVVHICRREPNFFIKGYKADLGTMRQTKDQIDDRILRYSIKSSIPPPLQPPAFLQMNPPLLDYPNYFTHAAPPHPFIINPPQVDYTDFLGPVTLATFDEFRPIEDTFNNRPQIPDDPFDLERFMMSTE